MINNGFFEISDASLIENIKVLIKKFIRNTDRGEPVKNRAQKLLEGINTVFIDNRSVTLTQRKLEDINTMIKEALLQDNTYKLIENYEADILSKIINANGENLANITTKYLNQLNAAIASTSSVRTSITSQQLLWHAIDRLAAIAATLR